MIYIYTQQPEGLDNEFYYCKEVCKLADDTLTENDIQKLYENTFAEVFEWMRKNANPDTDILIVPLSGINTKINDFFQIYPDVNLCMPFSAESFIGLTSFPSALSLNPNEIPAIIAIGGGKDGSSDWFTGAGLEFVERALLYAADQTLEQTTLHATVEAITNLGGGVMKIQTTLGYINSPLGYKFHLSGVTSTFQNNPNGVHSPIEVHQSGDPYDPTQNWVKVNFNLGTGSYTSGGAIDLEWMSGAASNAAAKIHAIAKGRGCTIQQARRIARLTASEGGVHSNSTGYGVIDVNAAVAYNGAVPADYYDILGPADTLSVRFDAKGGADFTHPEIENAKQIWFYNGTKIEDKITMNPGQSFLLHKDKVKLYAQNYSVRGYRDGNQTAASTAAATNKMRTAGFPKLSRIWNTSFNGYRIENGSIKNLGSISKITYKVRNPALETVPRTDIELKLSSGLKRAEKNVFITPTEVCANLLFKYGSGYFNKQQILSIDPYVTGVFDEYVGIDFRGADLTAGGDVSFVGARLAYVNLSDATLPAAVSDLSDFIDTVMNNGGYIDYSSVIWTDGELISEKEFFADIKIFLQGAYDSGSMRTDLLDLDLIPLIQPYADSQYEYKGNESVSEIPAGVVDWVYLEFRSTTTGQALAKRAAFLKSDGKIVDLDGSSAVSCGNLRPGNFYIVVGHRNHLPVMSSNKIQVGEDPTTYDFTTGTSKFYGTDAPDLGSGVRGMYAGDANASMIVSAADASAVTAALGQSGYLNTDINMSGIVSSPDVTMANSNAGKASNVPGLP